jgi:hypothetical protein
MLTGLFDCLRGQAVLENIAELDYEAAQAEKRDKLNSRLQIWSLFVALVGGFGLASLQTGSVSYVVALFPFLAACIARYAGHSELVLDQVKRYLYRVEEASNYSGYEHFNVVSKPTRPGVGNHMRALRDALVLTEILAVVVVVARLVADHLPVLAVVIAIVEVLAIGATLHFLRKR